LSVRKFDCFEDRNSCSSDKVIFVLYNWLRQNSFAGITYITYGIADIDVWVEGKPYLAVVYNRMWILQKGW
jgi:hypothetical protein